MQSARGRRMSFAGASHNPAPGLPLWASRLTWMVPHRAIRASSSVHNRSQCPRLTHQSALVPLAASGAEHREVDQLAAGAVLHPGERRAPRHATSEGSSCTRSSPGRRCRPLRRGRQFARIRSSTPARVGSVAPGDAFAVVEQSQTGRPPRRVRGASSCTPLICEELVISANSVSLHTLPAELRPCRQRVLREDPSS